MPLPYQGTPGVYDPRNPTLLPNFYTPFQDTNGPIDNVSPAGFTRKVAQVAATGTAVITGTGTASDVVQLNINHAQLSGGAITVNYTVVSGDTPASIAEGLADLAETAAFGTVPNLEIVANEGTVQVSWLGPIGNFATLVGSVTTGTTETITVSGALTGGSGPVYGFNNFSYQYNGSTMAFWYGKPYVLGYDLLKKLVTDDMPIG